MSFQNTKCHFARVFFSTARIVEENTTGFSFKRNYKFCRRSAPM